ncbi:MAG TPA: YceI family protein [Polyangia bacterium]
MRWDASQVEILVYTYREGLLAAVGHDLCLRVTKLSVDVGADDTIACECDATSLRASGVSADDARKIEKNAADDVLAARRFPTITFRSTRVVRDGERARIEGTLTLHGATRPLAFDAVADGDRFCAEVRLDVRDFGIKPYSAMFGALRVRADVLVKIRVPRA